MDDLKLYSWNGSVYQWRPGNQPSGAVEWSAEDDLVDVNIADEAAMEAEMMEEAEDEEEPAEKPKAKKAAKKNKKAEKADK